MDATPTAQRAQSKVFVEPEYEINPKKHTNTTDQFSIITQEINLLKQQSQKLKESGEVEEDATLIIFVHGFNNSPQAVNTRSKAIDGHLGTRKAITTAFNWKSQCSLFQYKKDQQTGKHCAPYFAHYIQLIRNEFTNIAIIAHSMGNYVLSETILYCASMNKSQLFSNFNIICFAPDVELQQYTKTIQIIQQHINSWTHYYNPLDTALVASNGTNRTIRAGQTACNLAIDKFKSISWKTVFNTHGYIDDIFGKDNALTENIRNVLGIQKSKTKHKRKETGYDCEKLKEYKSLSDPLVLVIGISQYDDEKYNLPFVEKDKEMFVNTCRNKFGWIVCPSITLYPKYYAKKYWSKREIYSFLETARRRLYKKIDMDWFRHNSIVLYFSGHGLKGSIVSSDGHRISVSKIQDKISGAWKSSVSSIPKLCIWDCCRGLIEDDAKILNADGGHKDELFCSIYGNTMGIVSKGDQNGSFFTRSICDVLNNGGRNVLDVTDLSCEIRQTLKKYSNNTQLVTKEGDPEMDKLKLIINSSKKIPTTLTDDEKEAKYDDTKQTDDGTQPQSKNSSNQPSRFSLSGQLRAARISLERYINPFGAKAIPRWVLQKAEGIVFLTVVKVGFLLAASVGTGIVMVKTESKNEADPLGIDGWSAPSSIATAGISGGILAGASKIDYIMILPNKNSAKQFAGKGQLRLGGDLQVAAGPLGRDASGSVGVGDKGLNVVYSYSHAAGLYAGLGLDAKYIKVRPDCNKEFYGQSISVADLLNGGYDTNRIKNDDFVLICQLLNKYCIEKEDVDQDGCDEILDCTPLGGIQNKVVSGEKEKENEVVEDTAKMECQSCSSIGSGKVDENDGLFYCDHCWQQSFEYYDDQTTNDDNMQNVD